MPLWKVYYTEGAYTDEDKQDFAERITELYTKYNLPAFYVNTMFHELPAGASTSAEWRHRGLSGSGSTTSRRIPDKLSRW